MMSQSMNISVLSYTIWYSGWILMMSSDWGEIPEMMKYQRSPFLGLGSERL
jgi:hypothetical protein